MKNKKFIIIMMIAIFSLFAIMQNISGEIYLWNSILRDNVTSSSHSNTVSQHAFYQYLDTSATGIGANEDTRIVFDWTVEALPYSLTFGEVDYCNFTINHFKHTYDSSGNVVNTTLETIEYDFGSGLSNSSEVFFLLRNKDSLTADMRCHYNDSRSLYEQNVLVGNFNIYMSSYECAECGDFSLEELSNQAQLNENVTASQVGVYSNVQKVIDFNYQGWLIASWIIKIGLIFVAVALIFASVYYFYVFFSNIGKELSR